DHHHRCVPRPGVEGPRRRDQPGHRRPVRHPSPPERRRKLDQDRATGADAHRVRARPGPQAPALRHERDGGDRHRPPRQACQALGRQRRGREPRPMIGASAARGLSPQLRRLMITISGMMATIMQVVDITIANVSLPYMQGSLSTTLDQVSWVLTSYVVAAAVMTAPVGWLAQRFGFKKLFITCVVGFTAASILCGIAQSIEQIVLYRV